MIIVFSLEGFMFIGVQMICVDEVLIVLNFVGEGSSLDFIWEGMDGFSSIDFNLFVSLISMIIYMGIVISICGINMSIFMIMVIENGSIVDIVNGVDMVWVCCGEVFELSVEIISSNVLLEIFVWIYDGEGVVGIMVSFMVGNSGLVIFNY